MNDLDRTLHDAFQSRHVTHDIRPSLVDVRWRARRRHNRRKAAVVGCAAITGAGAVAVLSARHPGDSRDAGAGAGATAAGAGDLGVASTVACYTLATTTTSIPPTTMAFTGDPPFTYVVQQGDTPAGVADAFGIPIELLDAVNTGNTAYAAFVEGAEIVIPTTTTMPPVPGSVGGPVPCDPAVGYQNEWHCTDWLGTDDLGRDVYLSCEQLLTGVVPTTTPAAVLPTVSTIEFPTTTTSLG